MVQGRLSRCWSSANGVEGVVQGTPRALTSDAKAPGAPTAHTAMGNDPRTHGWVRSTVASEAPPGYLLPRLAQRACSSPAFMLGVSTRRLEKLACALEITKRSKSQFAEMAHSLDVEVKAVRNRPLGSGPYLIVWADARGGQGAGGWQDRKPPRARDRRCSPGARRGDRRDPTRGPAAAVSHLRPREISWPRWRGRKQPLSCDPGTYRLRPA
jgi:hypothetical protein